MGKNLIMKWMIFFITTSLYAAVPTIKARKVMLPDGSFKMESPIIHVNGKDLPVGYRQNFDGACKSMGGTHSIDVENERVVRSELANVNESGHYTGTSKRIFITKSITCKI